MSEQKQLLKSSLILLVLGIALSGCGTKTLEPYLPTASDTCDLPDIPNLPPRNADDLVILDDAAQSELLVYVYAVEECKRE